MRGLAAAVLLAASLLHSNAQLVPDVKVMGGGGGGDVRPPRPPPPEEP
jgi:hypothetical protein